MTDGDDMPIPNLDDPDLTLAPLMRAWPATISVFIGHRMQCVGCPVSRFCTIRDACSAYDLPLDKFLNELGRSVSPEGAPR